MSEMTEVIQPNGLLDTRQRGYSQARIDDGRLFISGIGSRSDEDWEVVGSDIETQTRRVFEILETVLNEVDGDLRNVSKLTTYLIDVQRDIDGYTDVKMELFDEPYPSSTLIGVKELAIEELLIEIDADVTL